MGGGRSDIRAAIEAALDSCPINHAIKCLAAAANIDPDSAWNEIKQAIGLGTLPAQCIDDRGERIALAPHWLELLAQIQLPSEPGITDLPIGTMPDLVRYTDFPEAGILWFDLRRAAKNRLVRAVAADNRPEASLPPTRVRDVVVSRAFFERLIAALASRQEQQRDDTMIAPEAASSSDRSSKVGRSRGRRPAKRNEVAAKMREDLRSGAITRQSLDQMLEKELAARYAVSRDTARKARGDVMGTLADTSD